jgi:hypothetical protein
VSAAVNGARKINEILIEFSFKDDQSDAAVWEILLNG